MTFVTTAGAPDNFGIEGFLSVGDHIRITLAVDSTNDDTIYQVMLVDILADNGAGGTCDVITLNSVAADETDDNVYISNVTRMGNNTGWWDPDYRHVQVGVSTLYDDSKQESLISVGNAGPLSINDIISDVVEGAFGYEYYPFTLDSIRMHFRVWTQEANTFGTTYPRVSGFKVYLRQSNSSASYTSDWFLFADFDIDSLKTGMLLNERIINDTASKLNTYKIV